MPKTEVIRFGEIIILGQVEYKATGYAPCVLVNGHEYPMYGDHEDWAELAQFAGMMAARIPETGIVGQNTRCSGSCECSK